MVENDIINIVFYSYEQIKSLTTAASLYVENIKLSVGFKKFLIACPSCPSFIAVAVLIN